MTMRRVRDGLNRLDARFESRDSGIIASTRRLAAGYVGRLAGGIRELGEQQW